MLTFVFAPVLLFSSLDLSLPSNLKLLQATVVFGYKLMSVVPLTLFSFSSDEVSVASLKLLRFMLPVARFVITAIICRRAISIRLKMILLIIFTNLLLAILRPVVEALLSSRGEHRSNAWVRHDHHQSKSR